MKYIKLLAMSLAILCSGCCSVMSKASVGFGTPYSGTAVALTYVYGAPILWLDLPFDCVMDTAFLPIDLVVLPFEK